MAFKSFDSQLSTCSHAPSKNNGSTGFKFANVLAVPGGATVVIIDKNSSFYLEEGQSIRGGASAASDLEIVISYEEIS